MKKGEIYYVKWLDAQGDEGWVLVSHKEKLSDMVIISVGFLIDESKNYILLGLSLGQNKNGKNSQYNGTMAIPKVSIIEKKRL